MRFPNCTLFHWDLTILPTCYSMQLVGGLFLFLRFLLYLPSTLNLYSLDFGWITRIWQKISNTFYTFRGASALMFWHSNALFLVIFQGYVMKMTGHTTLKLSELVLNHIILSRQCPWITLYVPLKITAMNSSVLLLTHCYLESMCWYEGCTYRWNKNLREWIFRAVTNRSRVVLEGTETLFVLQFLMKQQLYAISPFFVKYKSWHLMIIVLLAGFFHPQLQWYSTF